MNGDRSDEDDQTHPGNTDDSEAETEIASRNQTPVKRSKRDAAAVSDRVDGDDGTGTGGGAAGGAESVRTSERKRKTVARAVSEDDSTFDGSVEGTRRGARESPVKKARLSPEADSQSDIEQRRREPTRHSERVSRPGAGRRVEINAGEGRSQSPTRSSHRRSASFHSAAAAAAVERERRSKRRFASHEDSSHQRGSSHQPGDSVHMVRRGTDRSGRTPLAQACQKDPEHAKELIATSAEDINKPDHVGNTPIQVAALEGYPELMQLLLDNGAVPYYANQEGDTPLIDAVTNGHVAAVRLLLEVGVDPRHKNREGKWASDFLGELDSDKRQEIGDLLNEAIKNQTGTPPATTMPVAPSPAQSQQRLDHINPTIAKLREYAEKGYQAGVDYCLQARVPPDNASVTAASKGGHSEILSILLGFGGDADPDPSKVKETPMLAVIGRGNLDVVKMLSEASNFNANRLVTGKHYWEISEERKGPFYLEEMGLLRKAASVGSPIKAKGKAKRRPSALTDVEHAAEEDDDDDDILQSKAEPQVKTPSSPPGSAQNSSPARRRRLLSGRELAEEERGRVETERMREQAKAAEEREAAEAEAAIKAKAAEEAAAAEAAAKAAEEKAAIEAAKAKAAKEEAAREQAAKEEAARVEAAKAKAAAEQAAIEAAKLAAEERAREEERRRIYIESLPRALRTIMTAGPEFPLKQPPGTGWVKTLQHYTTMNAVRRQEIEPDCEAGREDEPFVMNWQAAILLGHHRLDEGAQLYHWTTKAMTREHREQMWQAGIGSSLYKDAEWSKIPAKDDPAEHGCTIPFRRERSNMYDWNKVVEPTKELFLALPEDQLFWVKLDDFIASTRPGVTPRLTDITLAIDFTVHVDRERLPNGKLGASKTNVNLPRLAFRNGIQEPDSKSAGFSFVAMQDW